MPNPMKVLTILAISVILILSLGILFFRIFARPRPITVDRTTTLPPKVEPKREPIKIRAAFVEKDFSQERLPLRLWGTYEDKGGRAAYIEDLVTSETMEYRVGGMVRGAALIQILPGEVTLVKNGKRIRLTLDSPYDFKDSDDWIDRTEEGAFIVDKRRLSRKANDVNDLLSEVAATPSISDGRIDGFFFHALKEGGIINQAGFKKGDVIKSVNGEKLDALQKPLEVYESLRDLVKREGCPLIKVEIERDKKKRILTYRIF